MLILDLSVSSSKNYNRLIEGFRCPKLKIVVYHPNVIELLPPGGFKTRDDGLSVNTLPLFMLVPLANLLFETLICFSCSTIAM